MNKMLREVGFLALALAALFEATIYGHSENWLLTAIVVSLGIYFAADGAAWGHFETVCKRNTATHDLFAKLAAFKSKGWWFDLVALLCASGSLGFAVRALKLSQHWFENHGPAQVTTELVGHLRSPAALSAALLAAYFFTGVLYWWRVMNRQETLKPARDEVWGWFGTHTRAAIGLGIACAIALLLTIWAILGGSDMTPEQAGAWQHCALWPLLVFGASYGTWGLIRYR